MSLSDWLELNNNCVIPAGVNFLRRNEVSGEMTGHVVKTADIYTDVLAQTFFVKRSDRGLIRPIKGPTGEDIRYETPEVSDAKTEVADLLGTDFGGYEDDPAFDTIDAADAIVERLLAIGWKAPRA